jgi:hypothetical protein
MLRAFFADACDSLGPNNRSVPSYVAEVHANRTADRDLLSECELGLNTAKIDKQVIGPPLHTGGPHGANGFDELAARAAA